MVMVDHYYLHRHPRQHLLRLSDEVVMKYILGTQIPKHTLVQWVVQGPYTRCFENQFDALEFYRTVSINSGQTWRVQCVMRIQVEVLR